MIEHDRDKKYQNNEIKIKNIYTVKLSGYEENMTYGLCLQVYVPNV
jgi:hypothetical protein